MVKRIVLLLFLYFIFTGPVNAQQVSPSPISEFIKSNSIITRVGNPSSSPPGVTEQVSQLKPKSAPEVNNSNLKDAIKNEFSLDMRGDWNPQILKWIYERFYVFKQTNPQFINLISGEYIQLCNCYPNQESGYVQMHQNYSDPDRFIATLTHELGHDIYWHRTLGESKKDDHAKLHIRVGPATSYGSSEPENYADMVAYCLNGRAVGSLTGQLLWTQEYTPLVSQIVGPCKN